MKLIHYTNEKFSLETREYNQNDVHWNAKPHGLWVSIEGDYDWKWWCEAETFQLENLAVSYEIKLKWKSKILRLKSAKEILEFTKLYRLTTRGFDSENDTYQINWHEVKKKYQGIIIAPYQWSCRLALESCWYYGWDCASGCIWDLDCIKEFKLRNKTNE